MSLELGESSTVIPVETGMEIFAFIGGRVSPLQSRSFCFAKGPKTLSALG